MTILFIVNYLDISFSVNLTLDEAKESVERVKTLVRNPELVKISEVRAFFNVARY